MPLGIELHQGHRPAADVDDVANLGELGVHDANLTGRDVQPPGFKRLAEAGRVQPAEADGVPWRQVQLAQGPFQHGSRFTLVSGVEGLNDLAGTVDPNRLERYGADVDSYSSRLLHSHTCFVRLM